MSVVVTVSFFVGRLFSLSFRTTSVAYSYTLVGTLSNSDLHLDPRADVDGLADPAFFANTHPGLSRNARNPPR